MRWNAAWVNKSDTGLKQEYGKLQACEIIQFLFGLFSSFFHFTANRPGQGVVLIVITTKI